LEWAWQKTHSGQLAHGKFAVRGEPGFSRKINDLLTVFNKPRWVTKSPKVTTGMQLFVRSAFIDQVKTFTEKTLWKPEVHELGEGVDDVLNEFKMKNEVNGSGIVSKRRRRRIRTQEPQRQLQPSVDN
jgi:hypothetical protein